MVDSGFLVMETVQEIEVYSPTAKDCKTFYREPTGFMPSEVL